MYEKMRLLVSFCYFCTSFCTMDRRIKIEEPVKDELERFNREFADALKSDTRTLQSAIDHLQHSSGKHIRPLLLLLTARACGAVTDNSINSAILLELLHTATLIHDDVIDETEQRRGVPSVNALFDNKIAVLVGDYVLSTALIRSIATQDLRIIGIVSNLGRDLSDGEIKQLETAREVILDEGRYMQVIRKKTAVLLSACTEIGAITAGADAETVSRFRVFGENLGYAFQIKDDIFDYFRDADIGKPTGNDIREGKVTLPLLFALQHCPERLRIASCETLRNRDFTEANIDALIRLAKEHKGIEYAEDKMRAYRDKAVAVLGDFPDSAAKAGLLELADYIIERKK